MNREIKFRVFCEKHNRWEYYTLGDLVCGSAAIENGEGGMFKSGTWGEYTGLKDKNGKEIYEGDLLIILNPHNGELAQGFAVVVFSHEYDGGWVATSDGLNRVNVGTRTQFVEVIGNIYEIPELVPLTLKQS